MDEGYKHLITVVLNLDHDRYKSYFNYFIITHLGILTAIGSDFSKTVTSLRPFLCRIGVILSVVWLLVLYKVQKDIEIAWKEIERYEKSYKYKGVKIHKTRWKGYRASKIMLIIPLCFLFTYIFVLWMGYGTTTIREFCQLLLFSV